MRFLLLLFFHPQKYTMPAQQENCREKSRQKLIVEKEKPYWCFLSVGYFLGIYLAIQLRLNWNWQRDALIAFKRPHKLLTNIKRNS